jgi:integrase
VFQPAVEKCQPFPAVLCEELAALIVGKGRDDVVITDQRGGVPRNSNRRVRDFRRAVAKCQAADETFPSITPHDLRHTAVSLAVSAHANIRAIQRMVGHAKASMALDLYADLFDEDLDAWRIASTPQSNLLRTHFGRHRRHNGRSTP